MDPTDIPLFSLADRRLSWLDRRLSALAGNVANADTPGYRPRDLAPFAAALGGVGGALGQVRTNPAHLWGTGASAGFVAADDGSADGSADGAADGAADGQRAPDGNGVSLDAELLRMSETDAAHELVREVYKKYLGMFRTAAGR